MVTRLTLMQRCGSGDDEAQGAAAPIVYVMDENPDVQRDLGDVLAQAGYEVAPYGGRRASDRPACLILDVRTARTCGLDLSGFTRDANLAVVFLTDRSTHAHLMPDHDPSARDVLFKPVSAPVLLDAVQRAVQGRVSQAAGSESGDLQARLARLAPAEREVLRLTVGGMMSRTLAEALGTTEAAAKLHRRRVMEKMGARTVVELVHMAEKLGLTTVAPDVC